LREAEHAGRGCHRLGVAHSQENLQGEQVERQALFVTSHGQ
jgi:hypothetical protein